MNDLHQRVPQRTLIQHENSLKLINKLQQQAHIFAATATSMISNRFSEIQWGAIIFPVNFPERTRLFVI